MHPINRHERLFIVTRDEPLQTLFSRNSTLSAQIDNFKSNFYNDDHDHDDDHYLHIHTIDTIKATSLLVSFQIDNAVVSF